MYALDILKRCENFKLIKEQKHKRLCFYPLITQISSIIHKRTLSYKKDNFWLLY